MSRTSMKVNLHDYGMEERLHRGQLFQRKIEPIRGYRRPTQTVTVQTIIDGNVESIVQAHPDVHVIITGAGGEEFVFSEVKFEDLYDTDQYGYAVPRERFIRAIPNPFGTDVTIDAPWGGLQHGGADCWFAAETVGSRFTKDRYLIGNETLVLANYTPIDEE